MASEDAQPITRGIGLQIGLAEEGLDLPAVGGHPRGQAGSRSLEGQAIVVATTGLTRLPVREQHGLSGDPSPVSDPPTLTGTDPEVVSIHPKPVADVILCQKIRNDGEVTTLSLTDDLRRCPHGLPVVLIVNAIAVLTHRCWRSWRRSRGRNGSGRGSRGRNGSGRGSRGRDFQSKNCLCDPSDRLGCRLLSRIVRGCRFGALALAGTGTIFFVPFQLLWMASTTMCIDAAAQTDNEPILIFRIAGIDAVSTGREFGLTDFFPGL